MQRKELAMEPKGQAMGPDFLTITSQKNRAISIKVTCGHFTTINSHTSHYLEMSEMKFNTVAARGIAQQLALPYLSDARVDTIVCMDGTEIIAAYMAEELRRYGTSMIYLDKEIYAVTPMHRGNGQLIFHQSVQRMIQGKQILLLVATVASGKTILSAMDCLAYYCGELAGVSAIFSSMPEMNGQGINALFTSDDIPNYRFYDLADCDLCKAGRRLDAIVNSEGYSKVEC